MGIWAVALTVLGAGLFIGAGSGLRYFLSDEYSHQWLPAHSMEPTYSEGDEVWFGRVAPQALRHGDPVLATPPASWEVDGYVFKRAVALGGDRISWAEGDATLTLNGKPLAESYLKDRAVPAIAPFDVTVAEGRVFVMGDNRVNSLDSALMAHDNGSDGTLPVSAVRGVPIDMPVDVLVLAALGVLGGNAFLVGGGLGIASLVTRRRAAQSGAAGAPAHVDRAYGTAPSD